MTGPELDHDALPPLKDLEAPVSCWHESRRSARHDPVVAVSEEVLFIATERPLPTGTEVFFELPLGPAGGPPMVELDAVVVSVPERPSANGFAARLLGVEPAVRAWLKAKAEERATTLRPPAFASPTVSSQPPAAVGGDSPAVSVEPPAAVEVELSAAAAVEPASIAVEPAAIAVEPASIAVEPASIAVE
ncbi:MAG: hypothetical protein ACO3JL_09365, partial [Myxococcota bacterium]